MGQAIERLEIKLARVRVAPHARLVSVNGALKRVEVKPHWREVPDAKTDTAPSVGIPLSSLPKKLQDTIESFRQNPAVAQFETQPMKRYKSSDGTWRTYPDHFTGPSGFCGVASKVWVEHCRSRGHRASPVMYYERGMPDGYSQGSHCASKVDGYYIDWTARQYGPEYGFPHVYKDKADAAVDKDLEGGWKREHRPRKPWDEEEDAGEFHYKPLNDWYKRFRQALDRT